MFSGAVAELWVRSQMEAWRLNEKTEPGQWSLAQQGDIFWVPEDERLNTRIIETTLYAALPVPGPDVQFDDILEFKGKRNSELLALRSEMDALYSAIAQSNDVPNAETAALRKIELALANIHKVTRESWKRRLLSTLKVDIAIPNVVAGAVAGAGVAGKLMIPLEIGAALGAMAACVKLELKQDGALARLPSNVSNLAYAHKVEQQLGES
jgi:hypothetical protein